MQESFQFNVIAISISLVLMIGYNIHVYAVSLRSIFVIDDQDPKFKMQLAKNWSASTVWMQKHAEKNDAPSVTLAVQTFRNSIIVSTFVGTLTFQAAISMINGYVNASDSIEKVRILILSVLLFFSFLCWASVIRCAAHLGYKVGVLSKNNTAQANYMSYSDKVDIPNLGISNHNSMENGTLGSLDEDNRNDSDKLLPSTPSHQETTNHHQSTTIHTTGNDFALFKSNRSVSTASLTNSEFSRFELIAPETPGRDAGNNNIYGHQEYCSISFIPIRPASGSTATNSTSIDPITTNAINGSTKNHEVLDNFLAHECHMMMVMLLSFSLGFRFLFVSIPFFIFAAGPIALLILTFIMLAFLYLWDHLFTFSDLTVSEAIPKKSKPFFLPKENTPGAVSNISARNIPPLVTNNNSNNITSFTSHQSQSLLQKATINAHHQNHSYQSIVSPQ